jgi:diguanylate cyclase (GGDEF)-like protein
MLKAWLLNLSILIASASLVMVASTHAQAQAGLTGRAVPVCVAPANKGMIARTLFADRTHFDCTTPQTSFGAGDYWVRSPPVSTSGQANIRIGSLWQTRVTLHALYADGRILSFVTDGHAATRHLQLGAIIEHNLPAREVPLVRLLWRVEGSANLRGILVGAQIATPAESASSNMIMGAIYAGFAGLCVALLIYNLALWGALKHRFQLAYCAMLLSLLIYAMTSSGALAWMWPAIANNDRLRINYAALGMAAISATLFARSFFEPRVFAGWLARTSNVICALMLTSIAVFSLLAPWQIGVLDKLYAFAFIAQMAIVIPVIWRGWRTRSKYLWMFALAWTAPFILASIRVASALHLVGWNFWLDNSTIVTMTVEALLSSLAIAYRIRLLSLERDEAREQEIAARLLADTDPLTGLLNRRAFLRNAIGREDDQILLLADIDHFKRVNETIGHDGGDEVLRVFARTLRASVPPEALVARIGGEEFAIITPVKYAVEPEDILTRLRAGRMPYDISVTASIGTCTGPLVKETDWKALYRCADRALYEAKSAGRDRVRGAATPSRIAA